MRWCRGERSSETSGSQGLAVYKGLVEPKGLAVNIALTEFKGLAVLSGYKASGKVLPTLGMVLVHTLFYFDILCWVWIYYTYWVCI